MSYPKIRLNFETNVLQDDGLTTDKTTLQISISLEPIREFLGPSPSVISGKSIQSTETYTNTLLWKTRLVTVPRFGFF